MDVLLLHTVITWALVGLIWTIQLVQYPGFALVAPRELERFHRHHCRRITWIVGPLMLGELASGLALFWARPPGLATGWLGLGIVLILIHLAWTGAVAIPLHERLAGRRTEAIHALVAVNWVRTVAWTARGLWAWFAVRMAMDAA